MKIQEKKYFASSLQGCQMVFFKPIISFWANVGGSCMYIMKDVGIVYGHLVYLTGNW
jgi:hypothetical protein